MWTMTLLNQVYGFSFKLQNRCVCHVRSRRIPARTANYLFATEMIFYLDHTALHSIHDRVRDSPVYELAITTALSRSEPVGGARAQASSSSSERPLRRAKRNVKRI